MSFHKFVATDHDPQAPVAKKAAPKKTTKAPLASKKHPNDSLSDTGSDAVCSPPKKKTKADDDDGDLNAESSVKAATSNKNASEVYQKVRRINQSGSQWNWRFRSFRKENMF